MQRQGGQPAAKKATKLSVDSDLLRQARDLDVNLRWLAESSEAIASYNRHVEQHGVWSDGRRAF